MDRVLSARVDEHVLEQLGTLARQLQRSKKRILEEALCLYAATVNDGRERDVLQETCGAWKRKESAAETVTRARTAFRRSFLRRPA